MDMPQHGRNAVDRRSVETVVPKHLKDAEPTKPEAPASHADMAEGEVHEEEGPSETQEFEQSNQEMHRIPSLDIPNAGSLLQDPLSVGTHVLTPHQEPMTAYEMEGPTDNPDFGDYFSPEAITRHTVQASQASVPSTPGGSMGERRASPNFNTIAQDSPRQPLLTWKHAAHSSNPPTSNPTAVRPTSVPNFLSRSLSRNREGNDHVPQYPDQTFASLASQHHSPPIPTRIGRTRSSHSSNWSTVSTSELPTEMLERNHSGSKTVGGTPAQSPGLYSTPSKSPILSSKKRPLESDDGRPSSQILHHVAHLQPPIETGKLIKDYDPMTGRKMLNNYELIEKLGSGQHGTVKRGRNLENGEAVAVKIVRRFSKKLRLGKSGDPSDMIKKEVAILKKARHPHVVSLFEVIDDPHADKVYLVLEYVERGEIVWRKLTDKAIARFEMARLERERKSGYDENTELKAIVNFNEGVPERRLEKARVLENQNRLAREQMASRSSKTAFSLEHGNEPGYEDEVLRYDFQRQEVRMSRADIHAAENAGESPHSATPVYASQVVPGFQAHGFLPSQASSSVNHSLSSSQFSSRHASRERSRRPNPSIPLEGTMYGPYVEPRIEPDLEFQSVLQEIQDEQLQYEEWSEEEDYFRYIPCLTLSQALDAFRDTVLGLEYLHYQGIIHRDIKPANLLWTANYRVKISDFGVSYLGKPPREDSNHEEIPEADAAKVDEALELAKTVGTPAFYAPELCDMDYFNTDNHPQRPSITGQIDVWALGVTLYGMVYGRLPFFHHNEFLMYEKIAKEEVFIPKLRLKGVSHTDKTPSNHNKRADDSLEYEEVDDTLRDLLRRLLAKQPSQRISLKEVKHHPWVVSGIENKDSWIDETDPSRQSEGKKIEVSNQEVQDAVIGLTIFDSFKKGVQRLSSVLRGKRTNSNPKLSEQVAASFTTKGKDERRASLRGDEQTFAALLKQSREGSEHPLAQSVTASPELRPLASHFANETTDRRPQSAVDPVSSSRDPFTDASMSTADSMKTITARDPPPSRPSVLPSQQSPTEDFTSTTKTLDSNNGSTSSLGGIFGGAGRRLADTFRSRERGLNSTRSSRESSVESIAIIAEDYHASPSLGLSSALAAGHVDLPPSLREDEEYGLPSESSAESIQRTRKFHQRRHPTEFARSMGGHRRSISYAADVTSPASLGNETGLYQQRPASAAESSFAISSSSDQIVSGESTAHSRIPSEVSGASSLSETVEEEPLQPLLLPLEKSISPLTIGRKSAERPRSEPIEPALLHIPQEEEAGYAGEGDGESDSDSDDEGLAMA